MKADTQMQSLMPNFVNAGLWKVHCLGDIPRSHGALNNVPSFAVEPELKNKQNEKQTKLHLAMTPTVC